MAKPELGAKRVCPTTGRKFYDLNRDPIVSPYTGEVIPRETFDPPPSRGGSPSRARREPVVEEEAEVAADGPEIISLDEAATEEAEAETGAVGDDAAVEGETAGDDTFLEEEEEAGDDVIDLIDNDIEEEEES